MKDLLDEMAHFYHSSPKIFLILGLFCALLLVRQGGALAVEGDDSPRVVPAVPAETPSPTVVSPLAKPPTTPEKLEITQKGNHVVIKTKLNRMDLRAALDTMFGGVKSEKPSVSEKPKGDLRVLDFYLDIEEMLLPNNIMVRDSNSFFVYEDYQGNKKEEGIFSFVESLDKGVSQGLLLGIKRLQLNGKLINQKKLSDLSIRIAPIDSKQRTILIRSSDVNAMMKIMGIENFHGGNYVLHAKWTDGQSIDDWSIVGAVQIKDFYIHKGSFLTRLTSGAFSIQGLISAVTSGALYFEKMEFLFKLKDGQKEIQCRVYFGPEASFPCGNY